MKLLLTGPGWELEVGEGAPAALRGRRMAAFVPGCVHGDLIAAGVIPHPDRGDGEAAQAWVGRTEFIYRTRVEVPAAFLEAARAGRCDLVLECVDTVARVEVNGVPVGECASQWVPWRLDARGPLREGSNEICVAFRAPVTEVERLRGILGERPVNGDWTPYPFLRKSAASFGWDWGPRVPGCGLAGSVYLEAWRGARVEAVRPLVLSCTAEMARLRVVVDAVAEVEGRAAPRLDLRAELETPDGRLFHAAGSGSVELEIPRPPRWWPRGHGDQALCDLRVEAGGTRTRMRVGLRSVSLETQPEERGSSFLLRVNDRPIFCLGANWVPAGLFPALVEPARGRALLERFCDAGGNMLRIWGGGIYEPAWFHECCDQLGIMVWQDFMFACATYPEEPPYPALVEREARAQVARLSRHPSLCLWCGGNEDVLAWWSWGWRERLKPGQSWGRAYWMELLPRVVAELDPTRPYWVESPWSGSLELHPNDPDRGDRHTWDAKVDDYRTLVPRFVSEFGHQSPPTLRTLLEALPLGVPREVPPAPSTDPAWDALEARQRAWGGSTFQYRIMAEYVTPATEFRAWLRQAHVLQARAMRVGIEWLRANRPRCMGALFWQWNDVWSGHSWSVLDAALRTKPAFFAVQEAFRPRAVTLHPMDGAVTCVLLNDTPEPWRGHLVLERRDAAGGLIRRWREPRMVEPWSICRAVTLAEAGLAGAAHPAEETFVVGQMDEARGWWFDARPRDFHWVAPRGRVEVRGADAEWSVRVVAETLIRDLVVDTEAAWRTMEPNLLSLLPGESAEVRLRLEHAVTAPPVVTLLAEGGEVGADGVRAGSGAPPRRL